MSPHCLQGPLCATNVTPGLLTTLMSLEAVHLTVWHLSQDLGKQLHHLTIPERRFHPLSVRRGGRCVHSARHSVQGPPPATLIPLVSRRNPTGPRQCSGQVLILLRKSTNWAVFLWAISWHQVRVPAQLCHSMAPV